MLSLVGLLLLMVVVHDVSLKVAARDQGMLWVECAGVVVGSWWEWGFAQSLASKTVRRVMGVRDLYVSVV